MYQSQRNDKERFCRRYTVKREQRLAGKNYGNHVVFQVSLNFLLFLSYFVKPSRAPIKQLITKLLNRFCRILTICFSEIRQQIWITRELLNQTVLLPLGSPPWGIIWIKAWITCKCILLFKLFRKVDSQGEDVTNRPVQNSKTAYVMCSKKKCWISRDYSEKTRVLPTGVEPMTFQMPVGCSNHWAMGDSWWARPYN